ncbi:hypothetical protein [Acuticoccus kandeliae]|uniref:hypothetical protein n=1 Tax=Acuticoccus kandeliae TaxID=2073160 RepID=UPI000D3E2668|nr:hypothetical protein [Acuticoccus kandeliae]
MTAPIADLRFIRMESLDMGDREVLGRLIAYARSEAERAGEGLCSELLSAALLALNGRSAAASPDFEHDPDILRWPTEMRHFVA